MKAKPVAYLIDADDLTALRNLASELHGGSDKERDFGHRLWLIVSVSEEQPVTESELDSMDFDNAAEYVANTCEKLLNT